MEVLGGCDKSPRFRRPLTQKGVQAMAATCLQSTTGSHVFQDGLLFRKPTCPNPTSAAGSFRSQGQETRCPVFAIVHGSFQRRLQAPDVPARTSACPALRPGGKQVRAFRSLLGPILGVLGKQVRAFLSLLGPSLGGGVAYLGGSSPILGWGKQVTDSPSVFN